MKHALAVLAFVLPVAVASAQTPAESADLAFQAYVRTVQTGTTSDARAGLADPLTNSDLFFWKLIDTNLRAEVIALFEDGRLAKQLGTSATGSGTTTVVVRGDSPNIVGLALEHGLITGARTGETITLRGNLVGLLEGATGKSYSEAYADDRPEVRWLRKLSFSGSFRPTAGAAGATNVIDPSADQLTAWSARFDVKNDRDPRGRYQAEWRKLDNTRRLDMLSKGNVAMMRLWDEPAFQAFRKATMDEVRVAMAADVPNILKRRVDAFAALTRSDVTQAAVDSVVAATIEYLGERKMLVESVLKTPLIVFEYTNNRPIDQPRTHDLRVIAEGPFFGGAIVANGAAVLFDEIPVGGKRLRHFDGGLQWDIPLSFQTTAGAVVLSLASRVQYIQSGVVYGQVLVPNTKGTIAVVQLKTTLPIRQAGLGIPFSLTWANRDELKTHEQYVRGQVGMTFDFDSLLSRLSAVP